MQPRYQKPASCADCVLATAGRGYAPTVYPQGAAILFYAEALGEEEVAQGEPLVGAAGGVFSRMLVRSGLPREHVAIGNCLQCQPPGNFLVGASYEFAALQHCRPHVDADLARGPKVIVPMGATAIKSILNLHGHEGIAVKDFHGTVSRDPANRSWVVPTFHPSHLQRGAMNLLDVVKSDLDKAIQVAEHGLTRSPFTLVVDPPPDWFTAWVDRHLVALAHAPDQIWLHLDTEYAEKEGGQDESEIQVGSASPITRINVSNRLDEGVTVPYTAPYIALVERLLAGIVAVDGYIFWWNKYADLDKLARAGHTIRGTNFIDLMWLWHYLQSDLLRGMGFVAPFYSDFGAWKHWAKITGYKGEYAAADGMQGYRCAVGMMRDAIEVGLLDVFIRDWHERDLYVLRPAHRVGVPVDRPELEAFHVDLQQKQAGLLVKLQATEALGTLKPKDGYVRRPKSATPPATILGTPKDKTDAKHDYLAARVTLVECQVERDVLVCPGCGAVDVATRHRCPKPHHPATEAGSAGGAADADAPAPHRRTPRQRIASGAAGAGAPADAAVPPDRPVPRLVRCRVTRWFWQLPFNPDARAQILAYIEASGQPAPQHHKTRKATTNKDALKELAAKTGDPIYPLLLDWKAVQKVDSTYAVGSLQRLDAEDRLHPEVLPIPSTIRDSCRGPNLQNVVADRQGPAGLAAGFRRCVVARSGFPMGTTDAQAAAWATKYGVAL